APPPPKPVAPPPRPPPSPKPAAPAPPPQPLEPPTPAFDWESLLGIKGAAWVGGIAVVLAAILFLKLAFERNLITHEMQIALAVLAGVGCLVGAEVSLRRGYETTANPVSGAGVALPYAAFFPRPAPHSPR